MERFHNCIAIFALAFGLTPALHAQKTETKAPKNIILLIVDGMGPAQIETGEIFLGQKKMRFREFPAQNQVTTHNVFKQVTDSAAAATAIATGHKVSNGVISVKVPGDGSDLRTMMEHAKDLGKSIGLVTTTIFTDATPAAFAAHTESRQNKDEILEDYFTKSFPNVVFGADEPKYRERAKKSAISYTMATSKTELDKVVAAAGGKPCNGPACPHYYGGFGSHNVLPGIIEWQGMPLEAAGSTFEKHDIPHLSQMTSAALALLARNSNGLFLVVESGLVDYIGHANRMFSEKSQTTSSAYALGMEFAEMNRTLDAMLEFQKSHPDTLIIVTADHETGGLTIEKDKTDCLSKEGCLAQLRWTSTIEEYRKEKVASHTGENVGVFAIGPGSEAFLAKHGSPIDNTDFVKKIFGSIERKTKSKN